MRKYYVRTCGEGEREQWSGGVARWGAAFHLLVGCGNVVANLRYLYEGCDQANGTLKPVASVELSTKRLIAPHAHLVLTARAAQQAWEYNAVSWSVATFGVTLLLLLAGQ